ncbi:MAG TPA: amino acid permease [Steroidobacteraceae bacterium]|nr:amino acid permease [Steroidobacteraceae bacterium]
MSAAPPGQLPRRLNLATAVATIAGVTIGSGIFRVPAEVATQAGSAGGMLLVWVAGGLLTLCFALLLAELGAMHPRAGGLYVFIRESFGELAAFVYGWTFLLVNPAGQAAIAMVFAEYLGKFVPMAEPGRRAVAVSLLVLVGAANYRSVMLGAGIQNVFSFAKVVALVSLAIFVMTLGDPTAGSFATGVSWAPASLPGFLLALVAALWAYEGASSFCNMAGEVRHPQRNVPRALMLGVGGVMLVYLAVNVAYLYILPLPAIQASPLVAADAAAQVLGAGASALIAGLVMVSTFGSLAGLMMTEPRLFFAMGQDRNFFASTGRIHPRFETPHVAILVMMGIACGYASVRTFEQLAATFVLGLMPFYALAVLGVWRLRHRRPDAERPYRAFGYPWILALYVAAVLVVLGNALIHAPGIAVLNIALSLLGIPIFFAWKKFYR